MQKVHSLKDLKDLNLEEIPSIKRAIERRVKLDTFLPVKIMVSHNCGIDYSEKFSGTYGSDEFNAVMESLSNQIFRREIRVFLTN